MESVEGFEIFELGNEDEYYDKPEKINIADLINETGANGCSVIMIEDNVNLINSAPQPIDLKHQSNEGAFQMLLTENINLAQNVVYNVKFTEEGLVPSIVQQSAVGNILDGTQNKQYLIANGIHAQDFRCDICSTIFIEKSALDIHMRLHTDEKLIKPFNCNICYMPFAESNQLIQHMGMHAKCVTVAKSSNLFKSKKVKCKSRAKQTIRKFKLQPCIKYQGLKSFKCVLCIRKFSTKMGLMYHIGMHSDKKHKCEICLQEFKAKNVLMKHMKVHAEKNKCKFCPKEFIKNEELQVHLRTHTQGNSPMPTNAFWEEKPFECDICHKKFSENSECRRHRNTHNKEASVKCDICSKSFKGTASLNKHMKLHGGEKREKCDYCLKVFATKDYLVRHLKTHIAEKNQQCVYCYKVFSEKRYLQAHLRSHTGEKRFKCNICFTTYSSKAYLNVHKLIHAKEKSLQEISSDTGVRENTKTTKPVQLHSPVKACNNKVKATAVQEFIHTKENQTSEIKQYKCSACWMMFSTKKSLFSHSRIHSQEKRYKCKICPKSFRANSLLKKHVQLHTRNKLLKRQQFSFKCNVCFIEFPLRDILTKHLLMHTGEKPFECDICQKQFFQNNQCIKHKQIHNVDNSLNNGSSRSKESDTSVGQMRQESTKCGICLKDFSSVSDLTEHMRCHTQEKLFETGKKPFESDVIIKPNHNEEIYVKCSVCFKSFKDKYLLKQHMEVHILERQKNPVQQCNIQQKKVLDLQSEDVYDEDKPFECDICQKRFSENYQCVVHRKTHMGEKS